MIFVYIVVIGDGIGCVFYYIFFLLDVVDKVYSLFLVFGFFVFFFFCIRYWLVGSIDSYSFYRDCLFFDVVGEEVWM